MSYTIFERDQTAHYEPFLRRLTDIEKKLIALKLPYDPGWTLERFVGDNEFCLEKIKSAWCLHQLISVFRLTIKGPNSPQKKKTFFPFFTMYYALDKVLLEINSYFSQFEKMLASDFSEDDVFLLGILYWELLQCINPVVYAEMQELWENLYHKSEVCKRVFTQGPSHLHHKLRIYFHLQTSDQKIILLRKINSCKFHGYLEADVNPATIRNALNVLERNFTEYRTPENPKALRGDLSQYEEHHKKCIEVLSVLNTHVSSDPWLPSNLSNYLNHVSIKILECFHSQIKSTFSYLKPEDKVKFVFDAIVFNPADPVSSEWTQLAYNVAQRWTLASALFNSVNVPAPGTVYVRSLMANYQPTEFNESLYAQFSSGDVRRQQYQQDAHRLIEDLKRSHTKELSLKQDLLTLRAQIAGFHNAKNQLAEQILSLIGILCSLIQRIENHSDFTDVTQQFNVNIQQNFSEITIEDKARQVYAQLDALQPLDLSDVEENSLLAIDITHTNERLKMLKQQIALTTLVQRFVDLMKEAKRLEARAKSEQNRFSFPNPDGSWGKKFPFISLLTLLMGALGLSVSLGVLMGHPYFTMLLLPLLLQYTIPICMAMATISTALIIKSSMEILRYRFFSMPVTAESPGSIAYHSPLNALNSGNR